MPSRRSIPRFAAGAAALYSAALLFVALSGLGDMPGYWATAALGFGSAAALWLADQALGEHSSNHWLLTIVAILILGFTGGDLIIQGMGREATLFIGDLPRVTSLCYGLLAAAVLLSVTDSFYTRPLAIGMTYTVLAICLATLTGQIYEVTPRTLAAISLDALPWANLPVFVATAVGILGLDYDSGFPQCLYKEVPAARQLPLVLPIMIAAPLLLGLFVVQVGDTLTPAAAVGLTAIGSIFCGIAIVVFSAKYLAIVESELSIRAEKLEAALGREEQARARAESASNARDTFVSFLGHELRGPLNAATTWLDLMDMNPEPDTLHKGIDVIRTSITTQIRLVADLSDIARVTSGQLNIEPRRFNLPELVASLVDELESLLAEKQHTITLNIADSIRGIDGDPVRLQQVLRNLLVNAHRYTPEGGEISVALSAPPQTNTVTISVSDNGQGIEQASLDKVFDPYWRASGTATGLGIGLPIAKAIVEAHDGTLVASSEGRGNGATFTVSLPINNAAIHAEATLPSALMSWDEAHDN